MAWLTSATTVARSRVLCWRGDWLEAARFRVRLLRAALTRVDNLPAGFVQAVELLDRDVDWQQERGAAIDWASL